MMLRLLYQCNSNIYTGYGLPVCSKCCGWKKGIILVQYTCEFDVNLHGKWTSSFETNLCNEEKFKVEPMSCLFPFDCLNVESSRDHHYINYRFIYFLNV